MAGDQRGSVALLVRLVRVGAAPAAGHDLVAAVVAAHDRGHRVVVVLQTGRTAGLARAFAGPIVWRWRKALKLTN